MKTLAIMLTSLTLLLVSCSEKPVLDYYDELAKSCSDTGATSCCLESVEAMRTGGYREMSGSGCETGFRANGKECFDSKLWCAPDNRR